MEIIILNKKIIEKGNILLDIDIDYALIIQLNDLKILFYVEQNDYDTGIKSVVDEDLISSFLNQKIENEVKVVIKKEIKL